MSIFWRLSEVLRTDRMIFCVAAALAMMLIFVTDAHADIRSATGKPLLDFYTVRGAMDNVRGMKDVCNERYPATTSLNEKAYAAWQDKYKAFRYKVEQYHDEVSKKVAKGTYDAAKRYRDDAIQYEQQKMKTDELFLSFGEQGYRQACGNYPAYTRSDKADFAVYMAEHMNVFEAYWARQPR